MQRVGHIQALHPWWARLLLSVARAAVYLALAQDSDQDAISSCWGRGNARTSAIWACLLACINAVPRMRVRGKFARPEAKVLDSLRLAFFEELAVPAEEEPEARPEQMRLI